MKIFKTADYTLQAQYRTTCFTYFLLAAKY